MLWLKSYGTIADESPNAIITTSAGDIYLLGSFTSSLNLGGKSVTSSSIFPSSFIAKFDQNGNVIWCKSAKTNSTNAINTLAKMPNGGILLLQVIFQIVFNSIALSPPHPRQTIKSCMECLIA